MDQDERFYPENVSNFIYHQVHRAFWRADKEGTLKPALRKNGQPIPMTERVHNKISGFLRYGRTAHRNFYPEALKVCAQITQC